MSPRFRFGLLVRVLILAFLGLLPSIADARTRSFTSTTDRKGNNDNASAQVNANGTIRCTSARGDDPNNNPPACYVTTTGGGGSMRLASGKEMGSGGSAGTMTLTCNGKAPMSCSVSITD
jgi:hypothetical protein